MIVGHRFAWGHIPRTGGEITTELFVTANMLLGGRLLNGPQVTSSHRIHDTFRQRNIGDEVTLALNIRRLPEFLMSWIVMCAGRLREHEPKCFRGGVWPDYDYPLPVPTRAQLLDPDEPYGGEYFAWHYGGRLSTLPDTLLLRYTAGYTIARWLRLEHLKDDFLSFVTAFEPMNPAQRDAIYRHVYSVKQPFGYDHNAAHYFAADEIKTLYRNNPLWAAVEESAYCV